MSAWSVENRRLRPGIEGMRGPMGSKLRPCVIMRTPLTPFPSNSRRPVTLKCSKCPQGKCVASIHRVEHYSEHDFVRIGGGAVRAVSCVQPGLEPGP